LSHLLIELTVTFASRQGSVSYSSGSEHFLIKLEKSIDINDQIVIYPSHEAEETFKTVYDDFNANPLAKSVDTLQKIGIEVGQILKKED